MTLAPPGIRRRARLASGKLSTVMAGSISGAITWIVSSCIGSSVLCACTQADVITANAPVTDTINGLRRIFLLATLCFFIFPLTLIFYNYLKIFSKSIKLPDALQA